ncbi:MAG: DNA starvation/stationary phase protection protein [Anaerolineae bacterium]|nr:DNA starvation/stationary phase protection protein [Anaerolineae bacterium]NUQ03196.1 DNA starvation/stationary phase protection protein [Anaerolineae bacterium]
MATTRRAATAAKTNGSAKAADKRLLTPDIGLSDSARRQMCDILNKRLSDSMVLYVKLRNYHWNITGMQFAPLHALFEAQYDQIAEAIDEIAERIRQLGGIALGTLDEFKKNASLSENPGERPTAEGMIRNLLADHETVIRTLRADAETADKLGDTGSNDFFVGLVQAHEKMAWFLRAHLES